MPSSPRLGQSGLLAMRRAARFVALGTALCVGFFFPSASKAQRTEASTVRIGVLSLFHPQILLLTAHQALTLTLDRQQIRLAPDQRANIATTPHGLSVAIADTAAISCESLTTDAATLTLIVPGKLTRSYAGVLSVKAVRGELIPVMTMPTELAVASIVEAESPAQATLEALKAQAVVSRSYLLANASGHASFEACDTTHCQFLRSPPSAHSPVALATRATAGQVLIWRASPEMQPKIVAAMYSRSCGGHTRTHPMGAAVYPFYRVPCSFCLRQLASSGTGHGIGLCQLGAADMAAHGFSYNRILAHFFPNTTLTRMP